MRLHRRTEIKSLAEQRYDEKLKMKSIGTLFERSLGRIRRLRIILGVSLRLLPVLILREINEVSSTYRRKFFIGYRGNLNDIKIHLLISFLDFKAMSINHLFRLIRIQSRETVNLPASNKINESIKKR